MVGALLHQGRSAAVVDRVVAAAMVTFWVALMLSAAVVRTI